MSNGKYRPISRRDTVTQTHGDRNKISRLADSFDSSHNLAREKLRFWCTENSLSRQINELYAVNKFFFGSLSRLARSAVILSLI